jgi:ribosome-associated protein
MSEQETTTTVRDDDLRVVASGGAIHRELVIPGAELSWTAVRSAGPGGQNVNKLATKIDLRFDVAASRVLPDAVKTRLLALAAGRLDARGCIIVTAQESRSQGANLERARAKLADLIGAALVPPKPRRKTKPTAGAKRRRLTAKREQSEKKAARGRVRAD